MMMNTKMLEASKLKHDAENEMFTPTTGQGTVRTNAQTSRLRCRRRGVFVGLFPLHLDTLR